MERDVLSWSGQTWRMPLWLWLSVAAMSFATLHILLDASVGLFPARGTLAPAVAATFVLIGLIHAWWAVSLAAGARGLGGGVASAAVLGLGWTLLTNGSAIVYCMPVCSEAAPLSDIAHVGSIVFGVLAPAAALWALWRQRACVGWVMPLVALVLVIFTIVALANGAVAPEA